LAAKVPSCYHLGMKYAALPLIAFLALAASLPFTGCKEKNASAASSGGASGLKTPARPPVEGKLVLVAELTDIAGQFPANELYNYAYVMKYKVIQVVQGTYGDPEILVGHYNPRIAREEIKDEQDAKVGGDVTSFQKGDTHYLVLNPLDAEWTGGVEDEYFNDKRPRWWALWAAKAR
jgi:hypothetical protein